MRDRGVVTDPAPNPKISAADGKSDGMKSSQPVEAPNHVDPATRRAMLNHMLMTRGIDDEAVLLQNQGVVDLWLSCRGQEAAQVASAMAIGDAAVVFPSYREHAFAVV